MNTKLVYVLVSSEEDYYYEMVMLSLYSFRIYHPKEPVEVVMDEETYLQLQRNNALLLQDAKPVVVPISQEFNVMQRSRYLKTHLREIVEGDFLYIDSDTIICSPLDDIDRIDADMGMVLDMHRHDSFVSKTVVELNKRAGMGYTGNRPYYNGGVALVKDTPKVHDLFESWHRLWKKSVQNGVSKDQPALCQANVDLGFPITEIPGVWNCQINWGGRFCYLVQAKILHYYNVYEWGKMKTLLMKNVRKNGRIMGVTAILLHFPRFFFAVRFLRVKMVDGYYVLRETYYAFFRKLVGSH